jgi:hypothetical protein
MGAVPFDSPDLNLGDELLKDVGSGRIRLPDFQRGWKWDVDRISGLLASVSLGYPVGVVMLLETGGSEVEFATRLVSGVEETQAGHEAERLILDGQQRLTSLYQSLASGRVVQTRTRARSDSNAGSTWTSPRRSIQTPTARKQSLRSLLIESFARISAPK